MSIVKYDELAKPDDSDDFSLTDECFGVEGLIRNAGNNRPASGAVAESGLVGAVRQVRTEMTAISERTNPSSCHSNMSEKEFALNPPSPAAPGQEPHASSNPTSAGERLLRAAKLLEAELLTCTLDAGLNEARFNVLEGLAEYADTVCSQTELARDLLQSEANLSTLLERMRRDNLLSRERCTIDRRKSVLRLTDEGRRVLECARSARKGVLDGFLKSAMVQDEAGFESALCRLIATLERRQQKERIRGRMSRPILNVVWPDAESLIVPREPAASSPLSQSESA